MLFRSIALGSLFLYPMVGIAQESSEDAQIQRLIQEATEKRAQNRENNQVTAQHHYKVALRLYQESLGDKLGASDTIKNLREAKTNLETALSYLPEHKEARALRVEVDSLLGIPEGELADITHRVSDEKQAFYEQQIAEIENRYDVARRKFNKKEFDEAIGEFEDILNAIEYIPYVYDYTTLRSQIQNHIKKAKLLRTEHQRTIRDMQKEQASLLAQEDLIKERNIREKRIANLFERAEIRFEGHEYKESIKLLKKVLDLDPENLEARLMLEDAEFNLDSEYRKQVATDKLRGWDKSQVYVDELYAIKDPTEPMQYPPNYEEKITQRNLDLFSTRDRIEEGWKTNIKAKLQSKSSQPFEQLAIRDIIQAFQSIHGITIITDTDMDLDVPIDLPIHNMTFEQTLNIFTDTIGPDGDIGWTLKNGAIYIGNKDRFQEETDLVHYDVRDLIGELKDFRGPEISLAGGEEGGGGISIEETSSETDEPITGEDLLELIKGTVQPNTWDEDAGRSIQIRNGAIVVTHTPNVHEDIQDLLSFMRQQRALQVTIQTRFLRIIDNDVNHIGVDWRGLDTLPFRNGGAGNAQFDANTNGTGQEFSGIFGSVIEDVGGGQQGSAGYVGPTDGASLIRGNVLQSLGNGYQLLGGVPALTLNNGGLLNWQFLNDFQVSALINALTVRQKGTIVVAPMITSFNTQRANISILQQQAYIRDLTAVVNVQIGLFDPDIGYIQSGTTLDVRPIVSHDRKYITLELRPTIAELTNLREIAVNAAGLAGAAFIEAPEMSLRAIRTTVSVPDGGTLLIGGYSAGQEIDDYTGLPFFSKIPILSMLTGASLRDREKTNHYMLVKATVVDQTEIERGLFGRID